MILSGIHLIDDFLCARSDTGDYVVLIVREDKRLRLQEILRDFGEFAQIRSEDFAR